MRSGPEEYFERIDARLDEAFTVARAARAEGRDPSTDVEIPVAADMADRVENLLGIPGVAERVRELDERMGREEAALELARDFADGRVGDYETVEGKIEGAVRTAVALLTEGVVAAPIEGIDRVEVSRNDDSTEFARVYYAGPIRSAGGTAQALSVLVADYTRALLGLDRYKPRRAEVERYAAEVELYDNETGLQYSPSSEETKFIAEHCPIMLDGEPTGEGDVSGYRDLERVGTNRARGGMCLVLAEGIALKAPKIKRYTEDLAEVEWPWLDDVIQGSFDDKDAQPTKGRDDSAGTTAQASVSHDLTTGPVRPAPQAKYLRDLIAGRPVFAHPSEPGGFRLRYGRARNHGFATAGVHPATMHLVGDFLATGTQLKTERPGKAAGVVPVDSIEGPTVKLATGEVRQINDPDEALEVRNGVEAVLDLGEYLVNYGEFVENNHPLVPASYVVEWWRQDMEAAGADIQAFRDSPHVDLEDPPADRALRWAREYDAPLHPAYTYCWHDISVATFTELAEAVAAGRFAAADGAHPVQSGDVTLVVDRSESVCTALEALLVEHTQRESTITIPDAQPLVESLGLNRDLERTWDTLSEDARTWADGDNAIMAVNEVAPFTVRERAPTRVGARMGRPEKSEVRELNPAVHTLFPLNNAGGDQRDVGAAANHADDMQGTPGELEVAIARRRCGSCGTTTFEFRCPECDAHTDLEYQCEECGIRVEPDDAGRCECHRCGGEGSAVDRRTVDLRKHYHDALEAVGVRENTLGILKGVKGLTSETKTPEPMEKGVLRAKHGVSVFKDGTVRYDMTDLPVTAVRPSEINTTPEQLAALGYDCDIHGDPLEYGDQLVPLRVQDVVLSTEAAEHLMRVADFVDDLLEDFYGLEAFYEVEDREDLHGELVFGLAPHTSAAVVGRVVGFTDAAVGYAHPYFHAAKRRNCFHPDTKLWFENEAGDWEYGSIESFVEPRLHRPRILDDGARVAEIDGRVRVPSVSADGTPTRERVGAVSKHPAPEHLIRVETQSGTTLRVTPDHTMLIWTGELVEVAASEVTAGERVAVYDGGETTTMTEAGVAMADGAAPLPLDTITEVAIESADVEYTYCLTIPETHRLVANGVYTGQCDGDEDCVLLLLDGLLNFSDKYLPDQRGGRMDSPLVMSSRIDPTEIDDEAHNIDIATEYPREFYEAARRMADPNDIEIPLAADTLETPGRYDGFGHTHDTSDIALGPGLSAYKTLGSMLEKLDAQLELARTLRPVDESDVAERIIEYHFLPDLLGNLRAFSRQETRCLDCGAKYRRPPLSGSCRACGGDMTLTVHEGSVSKYMDTALRIAEEYDVREYTKQRLYILDRTIDSMFEDDTAKQTGIADFM